MKVITFSLWGDEPKYNVGAIINSSLARDIYPDWNLEFYCGNTVNEDLMREIRRRNDRAEVIVMDEPGDWRGMFWRFEPACDPDVEAMISRDCDSRLSAREKAAVDEWLQVDKGFHIMRDHPWHGTEILGGMWGCRPASVPFFREAMDSFPKENRWQTDQDFLKTIYPKVLNDSIVHASFCRIESGAIDFPVARQGDEFVGATYESRDKVSQEQIDELRKYL